MTVQGEKTVGLIGCGGIGQPLLQEFQRGQLAGWKLGAVLGRTARTVTGIDVLDDADDFFDQPFDLIIEAAGPDALRALGPRALGQADVWTVSGTALVNSDLTNELEAIGTDTGHRLRLVSGAIGGLDGVATLSVADDATVHAVIDLVPTGEETLTLFNGPVRQGASQFPHHLNVSIATALAGLGLDRTEVTIRQPKAGEPHTLSIEARSRDGQLSTTTVPVVRPPDGIHIVAASLIAALRNETRTIWVG